MQLCGLTAVTSLVLLPVVMGEDGLSDHAKIGLIVGCTVGSLIFVVLVLLVVVLLCCRAKRRNNGFYDENTAEPSSADYRAKLAPNVPPGIWTTKPSMAVGAPPYAARDHYTSHDVEPRSSHKYPDDNVYIPPSLVDPTAVPWYRRTVRQARKAFKRWSIFQVKKPETKDVGVGTTNTLAPRRRTDATQTDMTKRLKDLTKDTTDDKPSKMQNVVEVENAIRESEQATARAYCHYERTEARQNGAEVSTERRTPTATVNRESGEIQMSSDYQEPKDYLPPIVTSTRRVVREDSTEDGYAYPQDMVRMVQSDVNLSSTRPAESYTDWARVTSLQREVKVKKHHQASSDLSEDSLGVGYTRQHYQYARGIFMRSSSNVSQHTRPGPSRKTNDKQPSKLDKPGKFKAFLFGGSKSTDTTNEAPSKSGVRHESAASKRKSDSGAEAGGRRDKPRLSADYPTDLNSQFVARAYSNPPSHSADPGSRPQHKHHSSPYVIQPDVHQPGDPASRSASEEHSKDRDLSPPRVSVKKQSKEGGLTNKSRTKSVRSETSVGSPDKRLVREAFEFLDDFEDNISIEDDKRY